MSSGNGHSTRLGAALEAILAAPTPERARQLVRLGTLNLPLAGEASPPKDEAPSAGHDLGCILYPLPAALARRVRDYAATIPPEDLAPGKSPAKARESQPHLTLLYGLTGSDTSLAHSLLKPERPVRVRFGTATVFSAAETGKGYEVLIVPVEAADGGDDLRRLHDILASELPVEQTHMVYRPHVTLAYLRPGAGSRWVGWKGLEGETAEIRSVVYSSPSKGRTILKLSGEPKRASLSTLGGEADLSLDDRIALSLIRLGWVPAGRSRTGMPRWRNEQGKIRYQRNRPGVRNDRAHHAAYTHEKTPGEHRSRILQLVQHAHHEMDRVSHPLARHGGKLRSVSLDGHPPVKTLWGKHLTPEDHEKMARLHRQAAEILRLNGHDDRAEAHLAVAKRHQRAGQKKHDVGSPGTDGLRKLAYRSVRKRGHDLKGDERLRDLFHRTFDAAEKSWQGDDRLERRKHFARELSRVFGPNGQLLAQPVEEGGQARLSTLLQLLGKPRRGGRLSTLIRLGWRKAGPEEYRGRGTKWIGTGPDANQRPKYQEKMPGQGRGKKAAPAGAQQPAAAGRPARPTRQPKPKPKATPEGQEKPQPAEKPVKAKPAKPTVELVVAAAKQLLSDPAKLTHENLLGFLDAMLSLKLPEMKAVRQAIGAAAGGRSKEDVRQKVAEKIRAGVQATPAAQPQPEASGDAVWKATREAFGKLKSANMKAGGVVKVPELTDAIRKAMPGVSPEKVHDLLQQWQDEDRLTLKVVNDPRLEERAGEMIQSPRGVLGYVVLRDMPEQSQPAAEPVQKPPEAAPAPQQAAQAAPAGAQAKAQPAPSLAPVARSASSPAHQAAEFTGIMAYLNNQEADEIIRRGETIAADQAAGQQGLAEFARALGVSVSGSKANMLKQFKDSVNRLAVSHAQTKFEDYDYARDAVQKARIKAGNPESVSLEAVRREMAGYGMTDPARQSAAIAALRSRHPEVAQAIRDEPTSQAVQPAASLAQRADTVLAAVKAHPGRKDNLIPIADLVDTMKEKGMSKEEVHTAINELRRKGALSAQALEGRQGASPEELDKAIREGKDILGFVSLKGQQAGTPAQPAAPPAPAPGHSV